MSGDTRGTSAAQGAAAADTLTVAARFCGPPGMGNGGYVSGMLAALLGDSVSVSLRAPVPLDRALQLGRAKDEITLHDGDTLVARARAEEIELEVPAPPPFAEAERTLQSFRGYASHLYPRCFVCGPARAAGDGMRVFALPVAQTRARLTAAWTADAAFADAGGRVRTEYLWGALDCPGGFAIERIEGQPVVTAQLAARIEHRPRAGEPCLVIAWPIASNGRKHHAGSAIFTADGERCAVARALWIEVPMREGMS